jgi:hypothetical protein
MRSLDKPSSSAAFFLGSHSVTMRDRRSRDLKGEGANGGSDLKWTLLLGQVTCPINHDDSTAFGKPGESLGDV